MRVLALTARSFMGFGSDPCEIARSGVDSGTRSGIEMKKLDLHLGLQKTSSTSIQETFLCNPEALAAAMQPL